MARRVGGPIALIRLLREGPQHAALFGRLLRDPRMPILPKAVLIGGLVFALSPLNVPQYIPVIGALDDLGIALFVIGFFLKHAPMDILAEHREQVGLSDSRVRITD